MKRDRMYNQLAVITLILAAIASTYDLIVFVFPQLPINPLPPAATLAFRSDAPTPTIDTAATFPPTWTPTPEPTPTSPRATWTPTSKVPTRTPFPTPTATLNPLIPTRSAFKFTATTPFLSSNVYGVGCGGWFGVGGQVFDIDGSPLKNESVVGWGGPIPEQNKLVSVSGKDNHLNKFYGEGAYELYLGTPNDFDFFVTVYENGQPVAPVVKLHMQNDCVHDLVLINFQRNH